MNDLLGRIVVPQSVGLVDVVMLLLLAFIAFVAVLILAAVEKLVAHNKESDMKLSEVGPRLDAVTQKLTGAQARITPAVAANADPDVPAVTEASIVALETEATAIDGIVPAPQQ
jgi:hypothetical protein